MKFKILFFPIESTSRELESRLYLASKIKENYPNVLIIIGEQQLIRILSSIVKGALYFGKHLFSKPSFSDDKFYHRLKKIGSKIIYLHEEGVFPGDFKSWEKSLDRMMKPDLFKKDDTLLLWSEWQKIYLEKKYQLNCKVLVVGHFRFDLYKQESYRKFHNQKYDYLINTSFSYSNHLQGNKFIFGGTNPSFNFKSEDTKYEYFNRYIDQRYNQSILEKLAIQIALNNPKNLIKFRPHPSENVEYYRVLFKQLPNIFVDNSSSINDDLKQASKVVQIGCTTSIEAFLMNKPVFTFKKKKQLKGAKIAFDLSKRISIKDKIIIEQESDLNIEIIENHRLLTLNNLNDNFDATNTTVEVIIQKLEDCNNNSLFKLIFSLYVVNYIVYPLYWFMKIMFYFFKGRLTELKDFNQRYKTNRNEINNLSTHYKIIPRFFSKFLIIYK